MSEPKTLRLGSDTVDSIEEMHEDTGLNEHKAAVRALQRGLAEYGYGDFSDLGEDPNVPWLSMLFGEVAKALTVMGVAFVLVSITVATESVVVWFAAASLGTASLFLLAERNAAAVASVLGTPEVPPWRAEAEGEAE